MLNVARVGGGTPTKVKKEGSRAVCSLDAKIRSERGGGSFRRGALR